MNTVKALFNAENCLILCIDIQEKILNAMFNTEAIIKNTSILLEGASLLGVPNIISEQYPKGLGNTHEKIMSFASSKPIEKTTFGVFADEEPLKAVQAFKRNTLIICGIETHVCVLQSVQQALQLGFEVWLIEDALGSRKQSNHQNALNLMTKLGAKLSNVESFLFDLMHTYKNEHFKAISALIR